MMRCLWYRWRISNAVNAPGRLPEAVWAHVELCGSCRRFRWVSMELAEGLTAEGLDARGAQQLNRRILRAIDAAGPKPSRPGALLGPALAVAAGFLLMAASVLTFLALYPGPPTAPTSPTEALTQIVEEIAPAGSRMARDPKVLSGLIADPYADELNHLAGQAESGLRFLAACVGVDIGDRDIVPKTSPRSESAR